MDSGTRFNWLEHERMIGKEHDEKMVFVGQAPSHFKNAAKPLTGTVGKKITALCGFTTFKYLRYFRINLNSRWLGKVGKGDAFDEREGSQTAIHLRATHPGCRFVLLGASVSRCFGVPWRPLTVWNDGSRRYFVLPHPSGINRWWNSPRNRMAAVRALRSFVKNES